MSLTINIDNIDENLLHDAARFYIKKQEYFEHVNESGETIQPDMANVVSDFIAYFKAFLENGANIYRDKIAELNN